MNAVRKAVVLDVDGVILRHQPTLNKVVKRVQNYVSLTTGVPHEEAHRINEVLYTQFGHTYIGLQKLYGHKMGLQNFNNYVYTSDIIQSISNATYNVDALHHLIELQEFLEFCRMSNVPVYMFSNAPDAWCYQVCTIFNLTRWIPSENIISCDHDVFQAAKQPSLKPQASVYATLQNFLSHQSQDPDMRIIFVDDSFTNLIPVLDAPRWKPILFGGKHKILHSAKVVQVSSFKDLKLD